MTIENLTDTAQTINESETIHRSNGLLLTYYLPEKPHRKLNEELHYRIAKNTDDLVYSKVIELTLFGVDFKIILKNKEDE